jgi:two-component sensor histidine kinase
MLLTHPPEYGGERVDCDTILDVLGNARVTLFRQDKDLRYRWIANSVAGWRVADAAGKTEGDVWPARAAAAATAVKQEALATGRPQWAELTVDDEGITRSFDLFARPERDAEGVATGVVGLAVETTDRRRHATTLAAVAREFSHHSKNLLAIVQSLATHTARTSASTEEFIDRFRGRIQAIALSEELPSGPDAQGRSLAELVRAQVTPCLPAADQQVGFSGIDAILSPNATLHVGLALHELCVASIRFGALADPEGKVRVRVEPAPDGAGRSGLRLTWLESDGPGAPRPETFAKVLLERIVPAAVGGIGTMGPVDGGWRYDLTIAGDEFTAAR